MDFDPTDDNLTHLDASGMDSGRDASRTDAMVVVPCENVGELCEDGNPCTFGTTCQADGTCGAPSATCRMSTTCITVYCDAICSQVNNDGASCGVDGEMCFGGICSNGSCGPYEEQCADGWCCPTLTAYCDPSFGSCVGYCNPDEFPCPCEDYACYPRNCLGQLPPPAGCCPCPPTTCPLIGNFCDPATQFCCESSGMCCDNDLPGCCL